MNLPPALRERCAACGAQLTRHERYSGGLCNDWQCRRRRAEAQRKAELAQRLRDERDAQALQAGAADARQAPVIVVRWYQADLEPVSAVQRQALRAHLMALQPAVEALAAAADADQAAAADPAAPTDPGGGAVDALLAKVCARCTGYCCRLGYGRHAFLDAAALLRQRAGTGEAGHAELVDAYLAQIPPLHHADSCAFHGEHGCALPRSRRAAICNDFECPGLEQGRLHAERDGAQRLFVVRHDAEHEPDGGFVPPLGKPEM